jgi:DNA polymerase sigma
MKKISSILMLMLLTVSTFGNVIAQSDDSGIGIDLERRDNNAEVGLFEDLADDSEENGANRDLSFLRNLIDRIKNSDMNPRAKYLLLQRIRNYIESMDGNDDGEEDLSFLRNLIDRIKNSDMNPRAKYLLLQRIRNFIRDNNSN